MRLIRHLTVMTVALALVGVDADSQGLSGISPLTPAVLEVESVPNPTILSADVGPRVDGLRAGLSRSTVSVVDAKAVTRNEWVSPVPQPDFARQRGGPQMIIGGVALLAGAIIGGDAGTLIAIGGLGYGLYGLYIYLQ